MRREKAVATTATIRWSGAERSEVKNRKRRPAPGRLPWMRAERSEAEKTTRRPAPGRLPLGFGGVFHRTAGALLLLIPVFLFFFIVGATFSVENSEKRHDEHNTSKTQYVVYVKGAHEES